jgi:glycosyltransferase involved in cell wall biosynthesis
MVKNKVIYLDGRSLADPRPKGVARYTCEMLKCLADMDVNVVVISNKPYHSFPVNSSKIKYEYFKYFRYIPGFLFVIFILPFILFGKKNSIFWGINHTVPAFGISSIVTIHDLVAFRYASTMTLYNAIASKFSIIASLYFADLISTVSIKTKNELISSDLVAVNKEIHVITNIVDTELFKRSSESRNRSKYILILGSIEPRKNILNALLAFDNLCRIDDEWRLLIVGGKNWLANEVFESLGKAQYKDRIDLIDHIDDVRLNELYSSVSLLLFPSYDEGFGLPVFEAISCGCPVLATLQCELRYYIKENYSSLLHDPVQDNLSDRLVHAIEFLDSYLFDIHIPNKQMAISQIKIILEL